MLQFRISQRERSLSQFQNRWTRTVGLNESLSDSPPEGTLTLQNVCPHGCHVYGTGNLFQQILRECVGRKCVQNILYGLIL